VQQTLDMAGILFQRLKYPPGILYCGMFRAAVELRHGNLLAGRNLLQQCVMSVWGKEPDATTYCLEKLGALEQWSPTDNISFSWTITFLVHSLKFQRRLELHKALQFLGNIFQIQGDQDTASSLLTVALGGFTEMDVHRSRAECMVLLGDISKLNRDELKAMELWETARPLFERSSQGKQLADLNAKLARLSKKELQVHHDTLDQLSPPTEHFEQLSATESPNSAGIEIMGLVHSPS
jgi:hypothetical protein